MSREGRLPPNLLIRGVTTPTPILRVFVSCVHVYRLYLGGSQRGAGSQTQMSQAQDKNKKFLVFHDILLNHDRVIIKTKKAEVSLLI